MTTLLAHHHRRAAHGKHRCGLCGRNIAQGELYEDQRCADEGTVYTVRSHLACVSAYHSWEPDYDDGYQLGEISGGHLPPCPAAWASGEDGPCLCTPKEPTP